MSKLCIITLTSHLSFNSNAEDFVTCYYPCTNQYIIELGYLAHVHAHDGSMTATCVLDNRTHSLVSSSYITDPTPNYDAV